MSEDACVLNNYDAIVKRVQAACLRAGRNPAAVQILPVTKYALPADIFTLLQNRDIRFIAESRLQDSIDKWHTAPLNAFKVKKFFIGRLQRNKTKKIVEGFDLICSLDSEDIAARLDAQAAELGTKTGCLLQIKLTDRQTQGGVSLKEAGGLISKVRNNFKALELKGIMAIAPVADNPEDLRPLFKEVKRFFDGNFGGGDILSLGMSGDFEVAVEEGSTLPRIGGAIFDKSDNGGQQ